MKMKSSKRKVKIQKFEQEIQKILDEYGEAASDACSKAVKELGEEAAKVTANNAPVYDSSRGPLNPSYPAGGYKASITSKYEKSIYGASSIVYAKSPHYRLTHLLEHGHQVVYFGHRTGKTSRSIPHWSTGDEYVKKHWHEILERQFQ